jgi:hypothetical protein
LAKYGILKIIFLKQLNILKKQNKFVFRNKVNLIYNMHRLFNVLLKFMCRTVNKIKQYKALIKLSKYIKSFKVKIIHNITRLFLILILCIKKWEK